jgi:TolB-like protein
MRVWIFFVVIGILVLVSASAVAQVTGPYQTPAKKAEPAAPAKAEPQKPAAPQPATKAEPAKPAPAAQPQPKPEPPKPAAKPTLLVFDLSAEQGIEKSVTNLLTELVIDKVAKLDRYTVAGQKDLAKMVFWEQNKQLQGCSDTSCLVQIAGAMGAAFYIEGSVGAVGSQYIITLKLIDAQTVTIRSRSTMRVKKDDDVMVDTVVRMVGEIFAADQKASAQGSAVQAPFADKKAEPPPAAASAEAPRPKGWYWKWVALGGGGVFLIAGASFTGTARTVNDDYEAHKISRENAESTIQRNNVLAVTCYGLGLGLVGTGIWLWVREPKAEPAPAASFDVFPLDRGAAVTVGGRW